MTDRLVAEPVSRAPTLGEVLSLLTSLDEECPAIADPPADPEEIL